MENGPAADVEPLPVTAEGRPQEAVGERIVEPENALPEVTLEELPELSRAACAKAGWAKLLPVQARAIPYIMAGRNLMVQSHTGSGKTGAFLLPILQRIDLAKKGCQALVLVPAHPAHHLLEGVARCFHNRLWSGHLDEDISAGALQNRAAERVSQRGADQGRRGADPGQALRWYGEYDGGDRKVKKRMFRRLWITRINAGARAHGLSYNQFISGLKAANVELDRKVLADLAVTDPVMFASLVARARAALSA